MKISLKKVADLVGGKIYGNANVEITNVAKIEEARPGDITFLYMPAYQKFLSTTKATAVIIKTDFPKDRDDLTYIEVDKPDVAFQKLIIEYFTPKIDLEGVDKTAFVDPAAKLGANVVLGKNVVISSGCEIGNNTIIAHNTTVLKNVKIGSDCIIYPNVAIREESIIGNRVIIHSGTVIGSDGFGYSPNPDGSYTKVPQIGNVVVEDDVELGSNVSIDRAAMGSTKILKGAKIDNLVQIAHNVVIGEHTVISSQTGIAGSTKIGSKCILAGQAGLTGHIELADGVIIGAQSGVSKSITKAGTYFGYPAKDIRTSLRLEAHIRNLPNYSRTISKLESKVKELEELIMKLNEGKTSDA